MRDLIIFFSEPYFGRLGMILYKAFKAVVAFSEVAIVPANTLTINTNTDRLLLLSPIDNDSFPKAIAVRIGI